METRVAVVGCGHWGKNFVRVVRLLPDARLVGVVDLEEARRRDVLRGTADVGSWSEEELFDGRRDIEAVIIATPAATHASLVRQALERRWHVLVEKPFTLRVEDGEELVELAAASGCVLMLGHTFLYNDAVREMKALVKAGTVGDPYYLHARRTHLGLIRPDVNAVWDLAPHDIAVMNFLLDQAPISVSAVGGAFLKPGREDVAFVTLRYPCGVIGNIFISWADSHKVREIQLVGSAGRIVFNDLETLERVKVYEKGVAANVDPDGYGEYQLTLRDGNIYSPNVPAHEPLRTEVEHFLACVQNGQQPLSHGQSGVDVVRVLAAIDESMQSGGTPVDVSPTADRSPVGQT